MRIAAAALALTLLAAGAARAGEPDDDLGPRAFEGTVALRAGWAYGLGGEVEYRPGHWGVGLSGGWVPGYGFGGYLGVQWGWKPLELSGFVGEAGAYWGVPSPLRSAPMGPGAYVLGGFALVPVGHLSLRLVAGAGLPASALWGLLAFEFLAKLTVGWVL